MVTPRAQGLTHVTPVGVRQADVDDQEVRRLVLEVLEQFLAALGAGGLEALLFQAAEKHAPQIEIVLDDHDLRCEHGLSLAVPCRRPGAPLLWPSSCGARSPSGFSL